MNRDELRAEQLLQSVRRAVEPTRADAARNFSGVEARLGFALGGTPPTSPVVTSGAVGVGKGLPLLAKSGLVLLFGLTTGVTGYFIGHASAEREPIAIADAQPTPPPAAPAQPAPLAVVTQEVPLGRAEEPLAAPASGERAGVRLATPGARERVASRARASAALPRAAAPLAAAAGPRGLELREALELLGRAEAAVRRSDGLEARRWLSDLDRRAARGVLLEERLVAATLASCVLADVAAAQQTLRELQRANPESMYRARLEGSCVADFSSGGESKVDSAAH